MYINSNCAIFRLVVLTAYTIRKGMPAIKNIVLVQRETNEIIYYPTKNYQTIFTLNFN